MSSVVPIKGPGPFKSRTIENLSFTEDDVEYNLTIIPPVVMRGRDLKRDGSILSIGRLAACHVMGDMAGPTITELSHEDRLDYAKDMEAEVNGVFEAGCAERDVDDPVVFAALVYEALLRVGITAIPEQPDSFVT